MQQQKLLSLIRQAIEDYNMIEEAIRLPLEYQVARIRLHCCMQWRYLTDFIRRSLNYMQSPVMLALREWIYRSEAVLWEHKCAIWTGWYRDCEDCLWGYKDERPCSLCAKLRKGAMYKRLGELGINKIAYAHNKDDFIETALMSLIYEGRFYAFPPVTYLPEAGVTVIRPMMYVPEKGVANFVINQGIRLLRTPVRLMVRLRGNMPSSLWSRLIEIIGN